MNFPVDARLSDPPQTVIDAAVEAGSRSPCAKSKRGVALWSRTDGTICALGENGQNCGKLCEHAEAAAIRRLRHHPVRLRPRSLDLLHTKVVDGALVPSGPPSCWQCSKAILADRRIDGVWLFHGDGWRRYTACEFHRLTLATCELARGQ